MTEAVAGGLMQEAYSMEFSFRINSVPVLIGAVALIFWLSSERLLHLLGFRQGTPVERETLSSYWHGVSFLGVIVYSFLDSTTFTWTTIGEHAPSVRYVGVPFLLIGILVRILSRLVLGKQFSGYVQTTENHRLVTTSIYRYIRHPAYLGYLCLLVGFPITFGSIGGLVCAFAIGIPAVIYRIRIEEIALERWFPDEYHAYRGKTHKLIPFLW